MHHQARRESHSFLSTSRSSCLVLQKNGPAPTCDVTRNLKPSFSAALPPPWLLPHLLPSPQPLTQTLYDTLLGSKNRPALPFFSAQNTTLIGGICHTGQLHCSTQSSGPLFPEVSDLILLAGLKLLCCHVVWQLKERTDQRGWKNMGQEHSVSRCLERINIH